MKQNPHRITPESTLFPPTYMSSVSKIAFKIINDSSEHFRYEWRQFSSEVEENSILAGCDPLDPEGRAAVSSILMFNSPIFSITPLKGDIWANRLQEVIAQFNPTTPTIEHATAYLLDLDSGERIPYTFQGEGLPATASFNVDQINLGHVSLEKQYEYRISLRNTGSIPLDFQLIERKLSFLVFKFSPSRGHLRVNESISIHVVLEANHVGQFNETFEFKILNIDDRPGPKITLFGRVIGPTFQVSKNEIEFETVSYGFLYSEEFDLKNTSEIPFDYHFHLTHDSSFECREFNVIPDVGTIPKFSTQRIRVEFVPISIKEYSAKLHLDSDKFSERLLTIPISGRCVCPIVSIVNTEINLGELFLNYKYTTEVIIRNESKYPAKFEYIDCEDSTVLEAHVSPAKYSGIIAPRGDSAVPFYVQPIQLGHMKFSRFIRIAGSDEPPTKFVINCVCIGPRIKLSSNIIEFGTISVLKEIDSVLSITNDSLIPAEFNAIIESSTGVFSLKSNSASLEPGESLDFLITATLDDSLDFTGKLTLNFRHHTPIFLNVHAKGQGSGLVASIEMGVIDMDYIFTGVPISKKFQIQNFSRRAQEIKWGQTKPKVVAKDEKMPYFTFKIEPETYLIEPKEIVEYYLTFNCNAPCTFLLNPLCEVTIKKKKYELFKPTIKGEFVKPTVEFADNTLTFNYIHDIAKEEELTGGFDSRTIISPSKELLQPITFQNNLKNVAELPLIVNAVVQPPFYIIPSDFVLQPNESADFDVVFKPEFKKDFTSQTIDKKITFNFKGNPQQYFINLRAVLVFPNLSFQPEAINFGSLLKHTEESRIVKVFNTSQVPVSFIWELLPKKKGIDIGKVFDVYPIRGEVEVGSSIDIHITFFALDHDLDNNFEGLAVCHVIGGPDYTLTLLGSAAAVEYQLGPKSFDFGTRYFAENLQSNIVLTNSSDIPLSYRVKIPKGHSMSQLLVEPMNGTLGVGRTQEFKLSAVPGFPSFLKDTFMIQIGKVVDEEITLQVNCAFPQIQTTFPRSENDEPTKQLELLPRSEATNDCFTKIESQILMDRLRDLFKQSSYKNMLKKMTMTNFSKIGAFNGFILSHFEVDFGSITLGELREFGYSVKVVSPYPISFEFATQNLEGSGFEIQPTSFADIPPDTELEIKITFDAARRTIKGVGEENHKVPILFSADLASMLNIKSVISMPELAISSQHFEFETTLVGQTRTLSFQVANPIKIPIEFKIGDAQASAGGIQRNKGDSGIFVSSPKAGVLPPASFQNIDITFSPNAGRNFSMMFPITVKHNSNTIYLTVTGLGVEMKLQLEPSRIKFPPIKPFDEPISAEFDLVNPTEFPIEVFCPQFDLEIQNAVLKRKFQDILALESGTTTTTTTAIGNIAENAADLQRTVTISSLSSQVDKVKKFSMCIIVNGPSKSGRTTISNFLSKMFFDFPVISLKDVWKDLIEQNSNNHEDYVTALTDKISTNECVRGFIIDGLDGLPEPPETEPFIVAQMKQKKYAEDYAKNPFIEAPGENKTSLETALKYVLDSLSGQYVFQIALQATREAIEKHQLFSQEEEKKQKENDDNEEIEKLLEMNEEDYLKLSEEEQKIIDQKRVEHRKKILQAEGIDLNALLASVNFVETKGKKSLATSSKNTGVLQSTDSVKSPPRGRAQKKPPPKKGTVSLSDPVDFSICLFMFTLGRISKKIEYGGDTFQAFDPDAITGKKCEEAIQRLNSLAVNSTNDIETLQNQISDFLPSLDDIKEKALVRMIPENKFFSPKYCSDNELDLLPSIKQFYILNKEKPGDFPVFEKLETGKNKRKSVKTVIDTSLTENLNIMKYTRKYILEPGQREKITMQYYSEETGNFDEQLLFCIDKCKTNFFNVRLTGKCLYPDVERIPESIFESIVPTLTNRTERSFVVDINEFHFGALLIGKERAKNQPFQYHQAMKFLNSSPFEAEVSAFLRENGPKSCWGIESSTIVIPPGESGEIFVCFHPVVQGIFKNTVDIYVKDNPEFFSYTFAGEACLPSLELSTTSLDFEKLLLKQEKKLEILLKNPNRIPAIWRLNKPNQLAGLFTFSDIEGTVPPRSTGKLYVSYSSAKSQVVKKAIQLDVLDGTKTKTYSSNHISLTAESFDVTFDFLYPKGIDHLMIGTLKCGQSKTISCTLKNRGKYPSNYSFSFAKPAYSKAITIKPDSGTISPSEKPQSISFTVCSSKVIHLHNSICCYLSVFDSVSGTEMAKIPLNMTVDAVFSEYNLDQTEAIDFGSLAIGKTIGRDWLITNTGFFAFDFEIIPKIDVIEPQSGKSSQQRRGRKAAPRPSPAARGSKKGKLQLGFFSISQCGGSIPPGQSATVHIEFGGQTSQKCSNVVILKVQDVSPKDPANKGFEMKLKGATYVPGIEVSDVEKIFTGQNLCLRYDIIKNDTNAFLEDDQTFHFSPNILGKKTSIDVLLRNIFPVPCIIDASVKPANAHSKKKADAQYPFKLSVDSIEIPPLCEQIIQLMFLPTVEGNFTGIFKAEVRGGTDPHSKLLKFGVEGVATLPKISLLEDPTSNNKNGEPLFSFGKTLVNTRKEKHVCLKNNGLIPARISLKAKASPEFSLFNVDTVREFSIDPQQIFDLAVHFAPSQNHRSEFALLVSALDNPNCNIALNFIGEGFKEDVIFEGIPGDDNKLFVRDTVVGHVQTASFTMRNVCESDVRFVWIENNDFHFSPRIGHLRHGKSKLIKVSFYSEKPVNYNEFKINCQWNKIDLVDSSSPDWDDSMVTVKFVQRDSLLPQYGITPPVFQDDKNRTISGRKFPMRKPSNALSRTNLSSARRNRRSRNTPTPQSPLPPIVTEVAGDLVKVVEVKSEPGFVPTGVKCADLSLNVSAIADHIHYELSDNEISFVATMMYESRVTEVTLTNSGNIRFDYSWQTNKYSTLSNDYPNSYKSPFSVQPQSGYIEAGQSTTFKVKFAPEEVDEFASTLICDIPFLANNVEPPKINVTGFSRRPLCHFNVDLSDYITAGRRHPDYAYQLPEAVKVLELFSYGIGKRIVKKFEVINATAHPYEIRWENDLEHRNEAITCETPRALVSSGTKYPIVFSYLPTSVKTVESLWTFTIPEHQIVVSFLVVGKIMPK